jgi:hypothetical protein
LQEAARASARSRGGGLAAEEGAGRGEWRGPKFMLICTEPASRLPSAAPAASSAGHSAGHNRRGAPGGQVSALRAPRVAAGPGPASGEGGGRTPAGGTARSQVETGPRWATAVCPSGCAPSRRCSQERRPRAPRSSRGPRRPVPPATASTRRDGARGCARGHTSKRGPRSGGNGRGGAHAAGRRSHLPGPRGGVEAQGTPGRDSEGRMPRTELLLGRAPYAPGGCGTGEEKEARGPGAVAGILAVPAETFPAK